MSGSLYKSTEYFTRNVRLEGVCNVGDARCVSLEEDSDDVEADGIEVRLFRGQVSFGETADSPLLTWGDRVERNYRIPFRGAA
jgi:hypothetical protein